MKFPNLTFPITTQPSSVNSDHDHLQVSCPATPVLPSKVNPARITVESLISIALGCNWEFPEKSSPRDLLIFFRDQTSLLTSKATTRLKPRKHSLPKPYYTRRVKRVILRSFVCIDSSRGHDCSLSVATPTTLLPREQMQSLRHAPHRLGEELPLSCFRLGGTPFLQSSHSSYSPAENPSVEEWTTCNARPTPAQTGTVMWQKWFTWP